MHPRVRNVIESQLTGATSLHLAVERGDTEMVNALVRSMPDDGALAGVSGTDGRVGDAELVVPTDLDGATPLHYGATRGEWESMQAMLDGLHRRDGARDAAASTTSTSTAARSDTVERLVKARDCEGRTALHWAVANEKREAVGLLIGYGANVHTADARGRTALHSAALAGNNAIIRTLIDSGASVNATTLDGRTPLALALASGRTASAKLLRSMVRIVLISQPPLAGDGHHNHASDGAARSLIARCRMALRTHENRGPRSATVMRRGRLMAEEVGTTARTHVHRFC